MTEQPQPHDWRGVPIEVGAVVVYPSRQSSTVWMNEGVVVSIEQVEDRWGRQQDKIGVRGLQASLTWRPEKTGRVAYPSPERITVVGRPVVLAHRIG